MKLSDLEEQKFLKIYNRLKKKNNDNFDENFCMQLLTKRASLTQNTASKVIFYLFFFIANFLSIFYLGVVICVKKQEKKTQSGRFL